MPETLKVPVVLTPQPEGGYTVTSPVLPELVTEGGTREEALRNAHDALAAVRELYEDLGKAFPTEHHLTNVGKSLVIRGEVSSSEDLQIEGQLDGLLNAPDHTVTVGPSGRVEARVNARVVVVHGTLKGEVHVSERMEVRRSGVFVGDAVVARISIEDGAYFKGSIDIQQSEKIRQEIEPAEAVVYLEEVLTHQ